MTDFIQEIKDKVNDELEKSFEQFCKDTIKRYLIKRKELQVEIQKIQQKIDSINESLSKLTEESLIKEYYDSGSPGANISHAMDYNSVRKM